MEEISSIDEASEILDFSLEPDNVDYIELELREMVNSISPEAEFWAHCSNLQVWVEHDYDTCLIHSNLAFPLLKKLTEVGDLVACKKFKEEIGKRYFNGVKSVQIFLEEEGYLKYLSKEEIRSFLHTNNNVIDELEEILGEEVHITTVEMFGRTPAILIRSGKITHLKLYNLNLKEIPDCVQKLEHLEVLDVATNLLKEVPDWIGKLKSLKQLNCVDNKITKVSESLDQLTSLEFLDLAQNEIEELPNSIGDLASLKELRLYTNQIKTLPDSIGNLQNLECVSLNKNPLISLPDSIGKLKKLQSLDLTFNPINKLPISTDDLPSLKKLFIARTNINKESGMLKNLKNKKDLKIFL